GLLASDDKLFSARRLGEDGGGAEINVAVDGLIVGDAIEMLLRVWRTASDIDVVRRRLVRPLYRTIREVERHQSVGVLVRGRGGGFSRADIEAVTLQVDRRRVPDRRPGRSPQHLAVAAVANRLRVLHGVRYPDLFAGQGVKGDHAP